MTAAARADVWSSADRSTAYGLGLGTAATASAILLLLPLVIPLHAPVVLPLEC